VSLEKGSKVIDSTHRHRERK